MTVSTSDDFKYGKYRISSSEKGLSVAFGTIQTKLEFDIEYRKLVNKYQKQFEDYVKKQK